MLMTLSVWNGGVQFNPSTILGQLLHTALMLMVLMIMSRYTVFLTASLMLRAKMEQTITSAAEFHLQDKLLCINTMPEAALNKSFDCADCAGLLSYGQV